MCVHFDLSLVGAYRNSPSDERDRDSKERPEQATKCFDSRIYLQLFIFFRSMVSRHECEFGMFHIAMVSSPERDRIRVLPHDQRVRVAKCRA